MSWKIDERSDDPQLRALRIDEPDDAFRERLRARLAEQKPPPSPSGFERVRAWFEGQPLRMGAAAGVTAAAVAYAGLVGVLGMPGHAPERQQRRMADRQATTGQGSDSPRTTHPSEPPEASEPVYEVSQQKVALVNLHITSDVTVEDVHFRVVLPHGLRFYSEGEALKERSFEWAASLEPGDNTIPMAVIGEHPGRFRVVTTATIDGETVEHALILKVGGSV